MMTSRNNFGAADSSVEYETDPRIVEREAWLYIAKMFSSQTVDGLYRLPNGELAFAIGMCHLINSLKVNKYISSEIRYSMELKMQEPLRKMYPNAYMFSCDMKGNEQRVLFAQQQAALLE